MEILIILWLWQELDSALSSNNTLSNAEKFCQHSSSDCSEKAVTNRLIRTAKRGTCIAISDDTRLLYKVRKSKKHWWLVVDPKIKKKEFNKSKSISMRVVERGKVQFAEPINIEEGMMDYCVFTTQLPLTITTKPYAFLVAK